MPKELDPYDASDLPPQGCDPGDWASKWPELMSWVCDATFPSGKHIGQTQFTLRRRMNMIVAVLKVSEQGGLKMEVVESSVPRALAAIEAMLNASPVPWQKDAFPLDQGGKAKRK